jgi:hypothetical protein
MTLGFSQSVTISYLLSHGLFAQNKPTMDESHLQEGSIKDVNYH